MSDRIFLLLLLKIPESLSNEEVESVSNFYASHGREYVETIATQNKILPFAAHVLMHARCDYDYWSEIHSLWLNRNKAIKHILEELFFEFQHEDVSSACMVENYAVLLRSTSCLGCFCSGDVDLSADFEEKAKIECCLEKMNFSMDNRSDHSITNSDQVSMYCNKELLAGGLWINIMWKPIARSFLIQDKYEKRLKNERLIANTIEESSIRVLNTTALMFFNALHIASGHYYTLSPGIRLYVDIDRLARTQEVCWDNIIRWMNDDGVGIRISTVLYISNKLFDTPLPKELLDNVRCSVRQMRLINYLYDEKVKRIQGSGDRIHRLFVELSSDDNITAMALLNRILHMIFVRN